jgi:hypothetical protein
VPTGWWRDRASATKRLHQGIAPADLGYDVTVLVLEGDAKGGQPVGQDGAIHTAHASGSGDATIVEQVRTRSTDGHDEVVVTADRVVRERVAASGGSSVGPLWLLSKTS